MQGGQMETRLNTVNANHCVYGINIYMKYQVQYRSANSFTEDQRPFFLLIL